MYYTDEETGISLQVFSSLYLDYGLEITWETSEGEEKCWNNPCAISCESGPIHEEGEVDEEVDEEIEEEFYWIRYLEDQFDYIVDGFLGWENWDDEKRDFKIVW